MKIVSLFFAFALLALSTAGQCNLPLEKAPKLGGAWLGMTADQAVSRYGEPFKRDAEELVFFDSVPTPGPDGKLLIRLASNFDGIKYVNMKLISERVSEIMITYKPVDWSSPQEFAQTLSQKLSLPDAWSYTGGRASMECGSFMISARAHDNQVFLVDAAPLKRKILAEQKAAEDKKKAFKP